MASPFDLVVMDPHGTVWEGKVVSLTVPAHGGSMGILAHHAPLVAELRGGTVRFQTETGQTHEVDILGGVLRVGGNSAAVLADELLSDLQTLP